MIKIFRRKILRWNQDNFLLHTGVILIGTKLADLFNLLYRLILVRLLTVPEYGVLNTLISFSMIICQFVAPFQPALTKAIAGHAGRKETDSVRRILKKAARDLGIFSVLIWLFFIFSSNYLAAYLNVGQGYYLILLGAFIAASILLAIPLSFFQGMQLFLPLASLGAASAFLKLAVGLTLVYLGAAVSGALGGFILAPLSVVLAGVIMIPRYFARYPESTPGAAPVVMGPIYRYCLPVALVMGSFLILTNIDVILVKKFFSSPEAGSYSVAQMVGLIILYLPGAVSIVIFPKAAAARARNISSWPLLKKGLLVAAAFGGLGVLLSWRFPALILKIISGKIPPLSVGLVGWFALAMSFYALSMLLIFYHLAVHNTKIVLPIILLAAAQTLTIYCFHPFLKAVIWIMVGYSVITFTCMLYLIKYTYHEADPGNKRS